MLSINEVKDRLNVSYNARESVPILAEIGERLSIRIAMALDEYLYPVDKYDSLSDKLDEIIDSPDILGRNGLSHGFNIYPAKEKTDEIYPDFLCICKDKTKLGTAFSKMKQVSDKIAEKFGSGTSPLKNVLLITDKWDAQIFKKYEADFMYKAINNDIWFVILFVVGDELKQIPFLPNDRDCFRDMDWVRNERFKEEFTGQRQEIKYPIDGFTFHINGGTWAQDKRYTYYFNTSLLRWHMESLLGESRTGKIPKRALDKFLRNVHKLIEDNGNRLKPQSNSCDDPGYTLDVFNTVINWAYSDIDTNEEIGQLQKMIYDFIKKCDKEY